MRQNLQEELNRMKYLLNAERGKVISETEIKKTYVFEQGESTFNIDFKNYGQITPMATNVEYNGEKFNFSFGSMVFNALGPSTTIVKKPGEPGTEERAPQKTIEFEVLQGFNPNFVTPNEESKERVKMGAEELVKEIYEIFNFNKNIEDVKIFLGDGFNIESHADGSVPLATTKNKDVVSDHKNYGGLYGGTKDYYDRNTWLAKKRGENIYRIFMNNLKNYLYEYFDKNYKIIDLVYTTLSPKSSGGKTDFTIVNHLNKDGSANTSEIGTEYRKILFEPRFDKTPLTKKTEPTKPTEVEVETPGTYTGLVDIPILKGDDTKKIQGVQLNDEAYTGSLWLGISVEEYEKNKNIIPWVGNTEFNKKGQVSGKFDGDVLMIDNISFGTMRYNKSDKTNRYSSSGRICVNGASGKIRNYEGIKYYEVRYFGGILKK